MAVHGRAAGTSIECLTQFRAITRVSVLPATHNVKLQDGALPLASKLMYDCTACVAPYVWSRYVPHIYARGRRRRSSSLNWGVPSEDIIEGIVKDEFGV